MKKILIVLMILSSLVYAAEKSKKYGCVLAQEGDIRLSLYDKNGNEKVFNQAEYTAIKKEGINFKEIFVGSVIEVPLNELQ